jgi:hypothetical protein
LDTLIVPGVRILADVPESIRVTCAWIGECLSGSPAADDAALMVSRFAATAILYSVPGQPGDLVTVSVAIGRGAARIHVISQGARCQHDRSRPIAAATPAAGLTIVCALPEESAAEAPDRCLTFHIAGSARPFPPGGHGDDHRLPEGGPVGGWPLMISKITLAGWAAYAAWLAEEADDALTAIDALTDLQTEAAIAADQVFGPDWGDAATWSASAARLETEP